MGLGWRIVLVFDTTLKTIATILEEFYTELMAEIKKVSEEVYYTNVRLTKCNAGLVRDLKLKASQNPRNRVRLCTHDGVADKLHEMLIIHEKNCYVRPHKHPGKAESIHIIEGVVDIVIFDNEGSISEVIKMGDYNSVLPFYLRIDTPLYHTLLIRSEVLVFHEITNGPFDRNETLFAPWAPEDGSILEIATYIEDINRKIKLL
jgi:cupin fold WbuC family metalloprotein